LDHARLVTVDDLKRFATMHQSRDVLPDLIKQLVHASCAVRECRIPGRDDTNQPGLDGHGPFVGDLRPSRKEVATCAGGALAQLHREMSCGLGTLAGSFGHGSTVLLHDPIRDFL
jgi:hypothetical protein